MSCDCYMCIPFSTVALEALLMKVATLEMDVRYMPDQLSLHFQTGDALLVICFFFRVLL